ncbi:MAG: aldehyde dehydrogenase [Anaerolineaceae bacterium]|nr:aldehyde dehydrogenase [Anaerolineaceae bacterium]
MTIPDYEMLIDGAWRPAEAGGRIVVENPANENPIATVPAGQAADAEAALAAAAAAQPSWAATPPIERAAYLHDLADAILRETEHLARTLTEEQGKPLHEARGEVGAAANFIRYAAEAARRLQGDIFPSDSPREQLWIQRVPYGVVAAMIAWNFPLALIGRKCGPALVTGNTLVLLSHCDTPLTVLEFGKLVQEVGLPPGVINLVTGRGREIGEALVRSPRTDMVTLTGSVRAGREVYAAAAENITTIRLELGGKAPFIILEDADIEQAAEAAVTTRFANCGQVCTCNERMYVHADIYEDFMDEFVGRVEQLRVGDPFTDVHLGPKVNRPEVEKLERLVDGALAGGAKVITGGRRLREGAFERGHWYEPTVLTHTQPDMAIMREEIFGPIVPVVRVRDFEEALALANDSEYGLSAYLYTRDMRRLMRAVDELHFGEIYVNRGIGELVQGFHHGYRRSGLGGEDGIYGIEGYLQKKTLYVNYS